MAKVTRSSGRGTKRRTTDAGKKSSFSGKSYREYQEARKKVTGVIDTSQRVEVLEEEKCQLRNLPQDHHTKEHVPPAEEQVNEKVEVKLLI